MRGEVVLKIRGGVMQWYLVLLKQRMHLKAGVHLQGPANVSLSQGARAIALNRNGFKRAPRYVVPLRNAGRRRIPRGGTIRHGLGLQHESQRISRWLRFGPALKRRSDNRRYELGRIKTEGLF